MCLTVAKSFSISPKDVFDNWPLPMLMVTFVEIHNEKLTEYGQELEASLDKKPKRLDFKSEYIRNVTAEDLDGSTDEPENEAIEALKRQYWGR